MELGFSKLSIHTDFRLLNEKNICKITTRIPQKIIEIRETIGYNREDRKI